MEYEDTKSGNVVKAELNNLSCYVRKMKLILPNVQNIFRIGQLEIGRGWVILN